MDTPKPSDLPPLERAIVRAVRWYLDSSHPDPTPNDIAHMVRQMRWNGVRTGNRGRLNQRLHRLMALGLLTRQVGEREPSSGKWGRPPYRYALTDTGLNLSDRLIAAH